jgi:hypothetical protein
MFRQTGERPDRVYRRGKGVRKDRRGQALFESVGVTGPSTWQGLHGGVEGIAPLACLARCGMLGCAPRSGILAGTGWRVMLTAQLLPAEVADAGSDIWRSRTCWKLACAWSCSRTSTALAAFAGC